MSVPNQKFILIDRTKSSETGFFHFNHEIFFLAAKRLSLNGIRVFMYFMSLVPDSIDGIINSSNKRTGFYELYTSKAAEAIGILTKDVQRGVENLIEKGYLIKRKGNLYQFIDILPEDKMQNQEEHKQVINYQEELKNSLNDISKNRNKQLQLIATEKLLEAKSHEKYEWEE